MAESRDADERRIFSIRLAAAASTRLYLPGLSDYSDEKYRTVGIKYCIN